MNMSPENKARVLAKKEAIHLILTGIGGNLDILLRKAESQKGLRTSHMDEEVDEQELEAHYSYMAKIKEVPTADSGTDSKPVEQSRPNGKLIHNSILNDPYVRRMIPEPGDVNHDVNVTKTFHEQTDDELSEKELKHIEADDQAIQTILLGLPEDIYAAVDSCETAQEIWLQTKDLHTVDYTHLYDFLKYNQKEVDELKAERLAKIQDPLALMANFNNPYASPTPHQDLSPFNQNYLQQPMPNLEDITDFTTAMNMALALMAKAFKLNYSTPTNNNQRISSNPRNRQIAQPGMNIGQEDKCRWLEAMVEISLGKQYTELLEPIPEPQQVPQNNNNVISEVTDVEQGGET
nr:hypothetical protein [Tanacetum cinerariifolium]